MPHASERTSTGSSYCRGRGLYQVGAVLHVLVIPPNLGLRGRAGSGEACSGKPFIDRSNRGGATRRREDTGTCSDVPVVEEEGKREMR